MRYGCILFPLQNSIMNIKEINVARGRIIILMVVCRLPLHFNLREKLFEPYGKRKMGEDDSEWK